MVYYKNGKYCISELKVHYKEAVEGEVIKFVGQEGKKWWEEFARLWPDTFELIGFIEVKATQEQKDRLAKVNELDLPEGVSLINEYVETGAFEKVYDDGLIVSVDRGHPLYPLKLEKEIDLMQKTTLNLQKQILLGGM